MLFPSLTNLESVIQVDDKLRLNASNSFAPDENITDVLIEPELGAGFISVFNSDKDKWYLDWAYELDGMKTVTIRLEGDVTATKDKTYIVNCLTEEDDALFSVDSDIFPFEPTINDELPRGKNSFLYAHRKAQDLILDWMREQRIFKNDEKSSVFTKQDIAASTDAEVKAQFKKWSAFETLLIIFEASQVSDDDIFEQKRAYYTAQRNSVRGGISSLRLDFDNNGEVEITDIRSTRMIRRWLYLKLEHI